MNPIMERCIPATLKHRLFAAFILLILLPFTLLILHYFNKLESAWTQTFSEQSLEQMQQANESFQEMISKAYKTSVLLDQDSVVRQVLQKPDDYHAIERVNLVEERFRAINNSLFLTSPQVFYTLLDPYGHVYTSYMPAERLDYAAMRESVLFKEAFASGSPYKFNVERNYVYPGLSRSPALLSIHVPLLDDHFKPYAVARISIDYYQWFRALTGAYPAEHDYALVTDEGEVLVRSEGFAGPGERFAAESGGRQNGSYEENGYIVNYSFMPSFGWYMVKQVPSAILFAEVNKLKRSFFMAFLLFTALFVGMTLIITSAVTNPLKRLQRHMSTMAQSNMKIHLPEERCKGEVLQLTRAFNLMVSDIQQLIQQLKAEERRKEAIHFRMLHSQTNPHFLLNTLNTVKWIALNHRNDDIVEICVSLGKLLEAGLDSEKELIYLKDEIDLVRAYLRIQSFRYKKQYEVRFDCDSALDYALIPKLSLQPLVDNAIRHGLSGKKQGEIEIRIRTAGELLHVTVDDNGIGPEAAKRLGAARDHAGGIGLTNLRERLELLFKDKAGMEMVALPEGTSVRFRLPLLISTPYRMEESV